MKRRWPICLGVAMAAVALVVAWGVRPEESGLPPEIAKELTPKNRMPATGFSGSPPSGTLWEAYVIPHPYARVTEAMRADPEWTAMKSDLFAGIPKISYRSIEAGPHVQVDVMPGRLFLVDGTGTVRDQEPPENYSVVMVAIPSAPTFRKMVLGWVDQLLGRKPPTLPPSTFVAYQYPKEFRKAVLKRRAGRAPKAGPVRGTTRP